MFFFLDAGHGGKTISNFYVTPGKRSPVDPIAGIWEGVTNRLICDQIIDRGRDLNIQPLIGNCPIDVSLSDRVSFIKQIEQQQKSAVVSVHINAAGDGSDWHTANGFSVLHYPGSDNGIRFAELMEKELLKVCPYRSRGLVPRGDLAMLRGPSSPSILVELGFMTNQEETIFLNSSSGQWNCAGAVVEAMRQFDY